MTDPIFPKETIPKEAIDLSAITESQVKRLDDNTAVRYAVVETRIDLDALRKQKERIEVELKQPEPSMEELVSLGMQHHAFYQNKSFMEQRLQEINDELSSVK